MNPYFDGITHWSPLSTIAREFNKTPQTLRRWCDSGFILTLGYRTWRDPHGHWFVAPIVGSSTLRRTQHLQPTV